MEYKPYTPWDRLEKLKSVYMFDNIKIEDCPAQITVKDAECEIKRTEPVNPGELWGEYLYRW